MGCLPESGLCERNRTDPFVDHLNCLEGTKYEHSVCLDVMFRNSPQPEALYVDMDSGARLVIERKNLVWPPDYAVGHKNDHFVADRVIDGLRDLTTDEAYEIQFELGISGTAEELEVFARQIVETVRVGFGEIRAGATLGSSKQGRSWRFFRGDRGMRVFEGAPESGLGIHWNASAATDLSGMVPNGLLVEVSRLFKACTHKFEHYLDARRILVIDQHGDIRYQGAWWWEQILKAVPPPDEINELWDGMFDWLDDTE